MESAEKSQEVASSEAETKAIGGSQLEGGDATADTVEKDKPEEDEVRIGVVEMKSGGDKTKSDTVEESKPGGDEAEINTVEKSKSGGDEVETNAVEENKPQEDEVESCGNEEIKIKEDNKECSEKSAELLNSDNEEENGNDLSNVKENEVVSDQTHKDKATERHSPSDVSSTGNDERAEVHEPPDKTETKLTEESNKTDVLESASSSKESPDHVEISLSEETEKKSPIGNVAEDIREEQNIIDDGGHSEETSKNQDESAESHDSKAADSKASDEVPCEEGMDVEEKSENICKNEEEINSANKEDTCETGVKENNEKKPVDEVDTSSTCSSKEETNLSDKNYTNQTDTASVENEQKENDKSKISEAEDKPVEAGQEKSTASTCEKMEVDNPVEDKVPSASEDHAVEPEDGIQAMESADVDNECPDENMDVATHHDEDDPLSSAAAGRDEAESQMDVDDTQKETENTIVEIHEDLLKDEDVKDELQADEESLEEDLPDRAVETAATSSVETTVEQSSKEDGDTSKKAKEGASKSSGEKDAGDKTDNGDVSKSKEDNLTDKGQESSTREVDDDVCIIPDTVPQIEPKRIKDISRKDRKSSTLESSSDKKRKAVSEDEKEEPTTETKTKQRRKPRNVSPVDIHAVRPQRQAARKAESQIKQVLAAVESYEPASETAESPGLSDSAAEEPASPKSTVVERSTDVNPCQNCGLVTVCPHQQQKKGKTIHFCTQTCFKEFQETENANVSRPVEISRETAASPITVVPQLGMEVDRPFVRTCSQCTAIINTADDRILTWETMDFCNEDCLGKYQTDLGSHCANCKGSVRSTSLGKYCVRFGYDIKQFCCSGCLEEFKKGLKVCSYCQKDISGDEGGFLAPVGDKGQFKDFCTSACMEKYEQMSSSVAPRAPRHECAVCNKMAPVRVEVIQKNRVHQLCSTPCFAAFKFVNTIVADQCDMCKKFFDKATSENYTIYYDDAPHSFCCKTCMNVYILAKRKIVPCTWCKVKKYNFDMIKKGAGTGQVVMMCSLNCLTLYQVSVNAVSVRRYACDACGGTALAQYHLTMSDSTLRNFCSYNCVGNFQSQFSRSTIAAGGKADSPVPTGGPKRAIARRPVVNTEAETGTKGGAMPVISNVTSLAPNGEPTPSVTAASTLKVRARPRKIIIQRSDSSHQADSEHSSQADFSKQPTSEATKVPKAHIIVRPPHPPQRQNCGVQVRPFMHNKGVSCRPQPCTKETQTDDELNRPAIVPIPVPIYIPAPMCMYSTPFPVPVPFPLPIPVPIFIPTTRNSTKGIMKEIKRIQEKIPNDPFEAELLMMAEMVAGKKSEEASDTESEENEERPEEPSTADAGNGETENFSPEAEVDTSNTFGEDMLQMALKIASALDEPAVDFEQAVASSTIVPGAQNTSTTSTTVQSDDDDSNPDDPEPIERKTRSGRKRVSRSLSRTQSATPTKRHRRVSSSESLPVLPPGDGTGSSSKTDVEKPDANMSLKYTYGVNAWRQWVLQKNAQLEKGATNNRKLKLFKTDLLQLTSDELNYSLCLFVKEVRKPNGSEYAPDTIYYLCLGIQLYLIENGRVDNIFSDPFYEKFTECLDEVAKKFSALYDDTQFIVTRVEEEHLWESKQLGAHSPYVLLSTLMFFNTKHFNITSVDEHMLLSFSHIMKHWKKNALPPSSGKVWGRNVLLRFYPSQASLESNTKKKKVYEQSENEDNPLRCPVKLYEFYLSKCPESVKTRNDVFYLQPERSCVPDSPVWYSTSSLGKEPLLKMLRRVKMVKEINEAILK